MLDVDQQAPKARSSSLAQWVYNAIGQPEVRLRVRVGGNNLHILCESRQGLDAKTVVNRLLKALESRETQEPFPIDPENPIYQLIIYGRTLGQERPDWIKQIRLKPAVAQSAQARTEAAAASLNAPTDSQLKVSNESLARSGSPEAIARYLSETLSSLGVSVKVIIQDLNVEFSKEQASTSNRRLWVICNSNYSPDASVLAEPIVEQLRSLRLQGFRDAAICSQVSGEASPEWMLRVDLTPSEQMLKEWARWGDVQAITRRLNQALLRVAMEVRAVLKDATLHLFCNPLAAKPNTAPDKPKAVSVITEVLEMIAPQGIQAATVYGVEASERPLAPEEETPIWIEWLNLAAANHPVLGESAYSLAQKGNQDALTFLLERLLNPDLDRRLATGGIHLKIRRKQDLLHIMSEAPICPPQAQVAPPIARFLRQLAVPGIAGVRIYGRRAGSTSPAWNYGVDFVQRQRLVPEATPEFAASDAYVNELVAPTGEPVLRPDVTKEDLEDGLRQTLQATVRIGQRILCASQLFVLSEDNQETTLVPHRASTKNFASFQGFRVALVWGLIGLLLTVQADWLTGQMLRTPAKPSSMRAFQSEEANATQDAAPAISLPNISLQKGGVQGSNHFNASGFTRNGESRVIINESGSSLSSEKATAAKAAMLAAARSPNPSFNNPLLDEKLALYQQQVLRSGPPDILIIGSSRALRGVDPSALQDALAAQGHPNVEVFNFGINGATAQVVDLVIRRIFTPEQLPKLIIWADGARAFNSGREDATYNAIASSEGYQKLQAGTFPTLVEGNHRNRNFGKSAGSNTPEEDKGFASLRTSYQSLGDWLNQSLARFSSTYSQRNKLKFLLREQYISVLKHTNISPAKTDNNSDPVLNKGETIDLDGFLPLSIRYNPATYYKNHPRVAGDYDGDYQSFKLLGEQDTALESLLQFTQRNNIDLVFVNLPLSKDYLDPARTEYEAKFQQYMRSSGIQKGLIFRDLSQLLLTKPDYFSDPSHLNRYGAYKVSNQLAQDSMIPWPTKKRRN
ncbi:MAG TPA: hypothetical protein V6D11_33040 [Waterburya sp.]|jgi:hypothetical protein